MNSTTLASTRCAVIAALGGLLFGFDTAVISGTTDALADVFELDAAGLGFAVASALIGTVIGAIAVGKPADLVGRRSVMFLLAILYFVSALGSALAWNDLSFILFRFIGGLGVGGASVVAPMYIAEIAPARRRGRLVALAQFNIVLGILLAFASNFVIATVGERLTGHPVGTDEYRAWFLDYGWRWMLGVEAVPAAAYFALLFSVPESPRWLVARGRRDEATRVLKQVGTDENRSAEDEIGEIQASIDFDRDALHEKLFQRKYSTPILLAVAIAAFNQLSGINAILYYAPTIFRSAGFQESAGLLNSVGLGLMNLVFTMIGMALIDSFGRKKLMLIGSVGYILSLGTATAAFLAFSELVTSDAGESMRTFTNTSAGYVVFASLMVFIASHAVGQGAVIWVFLGEIFPNKVRARGQALGSFTHWIFAAIISQTFPMIAEFSGGYVFAFYTVCMIAQLVWVVLVMPETKGVPLERIHERLGVTRP
ncbi:MAG: sugar porter family MFS transporter [Planctomycetota bacterium]